MSYCELGVGIGWVGGWVGGTYRTRSGMLYLITAQKVLNMKLAGQTRTLRSLSILGGEVGGWVNELFSLC